MLESLAYWELPILEWIQANLHTPFLDRFFSIITHLGDSGWFWIVFALVLLIFKKTRRWGFCMAIALLLCVSIGNGILKPLIGRERPFAMDSNLILLISPPHDASFPSGHTLSSFSAATTLLYWVQKRWVGICAIILAALIAISRLYLVVHFPSDVLAGTLLGILFGIVAYHLVKWFYNRFSVFQKYGGDSFHSSAKA